MLFVHCHVRGIAQVYFVLDDGDFGRFHDALHKEGASQDEADFYGNGEVEDDGQEEGHAEHDDIALRVLQQASNRAPAAHVVTHENKHCGQRSHRDVLGVRHQEQQNGEQHDGMDDACHRRASAIVDVRHGAGNGSRGGNAAKERRHHVRHALRNQLHVRVVLVADDTVGNCCGEQTLDGSEDGYGESNRHELLDEFKGNARHNHLGQLSLDVEAVADGINAFYAILLHNEHRRSTKQDAVERAGYLVEAGHLLQRLGREDDDKQRADGDDEVPGVERPYVLGIANPFAHKVAWCLQGDAEGFACRADGGLRQAEDVADLRCEDGQGNTCREAYYNRIRYELDDNTQPEGTQGNEDDAGQDGGNKQSLQTILRVIDDAVDDDDEGSRRAAYLYFRAAQQRDKEACDNGCDDAFLGCHTAGDAECDGKGQGHDAHNDARHQVLHKHFLCVAVQTANESWLKSFHNYSFSAAKVQIILIS